MALQGNLLKLCLVAIHHYISYLPKRKPEYVWKIWAVSQYSARNSVSIHIYIFILIIKITKTSSTQLDVIWLISILNSNSISSQFEIWIGREFIFIVRQIEDVKLRRQKTNDMKISWCVYPLSLKWHHTISFVRSFPELVDRQITH